MAASRRDECLWIPIQVLNSYTHTSSWCEILQPVKDQSVRRLQRKVLYKTVRQSPLVLQRLQTKSLTMGQKTSQRNAKRRRVRQVDVALSRKSKHFGWLSFLISAVPGYLRWLKVMDLLVQLVCLRKVCMTFWSRWRGQSQFCCYR